MRISQKLKLCSRRKICPGPAIEPCTNQRLYAAAIVLPTEATSRLAKVVFVHICERFGPMADFLRGWQEK